MRVQFNNLRIISTHALTEGDSAARSVSRTCSDFNSRPHGGRLERQHEKNDVIGFQLTPSRRATLGNGWREYSERHFNSRPHGGRPLSSFSGIHDGFISTHALTEGDGDGRNKNIFRCISTHALTEGDLSQDTKTTRRNISTHALTEGDCFL